MICAGKVRDEGEVLSISRNGHLQTTEIDFSRRMIQMTYVNGSMPRQTPIVILLPLVLCITPLTGPCAGAADIKPQPADFEGTDAVEYSAVGEEENLRILMTVGGATRVDFRTTVDKDEQIRTVFLPANEKEVDRLVRTCGRPYWGGRDYSPQHA